MRINYDYVPIASSFVGIKDIYEGGVKVFNKTKEFWKAKKEEEKTQKTGLILYGSGKREAKRGIEEGFKTVGRGFVELVPVIGNISLFTYDFFKKKPIDYK